MSYSGGIGGGQETGTYAAPSAQGTMTYSGGVAAPSAQGTVMYSGGVGGGQQTVTYAAPSVQGAVTYSGGVGSAAGNGYAASQTMTYAAPQVTYSQGQVGMQTSTVSSEQQLTDAKSLFDQLDINGDGVLTRDEFAKLVAEGDFARLVSGAMHVSQS